jgi:hypothetical protein
MENPIALIEVHQKRVDKMNEEAIAIAPNAISLDLLQAVYRSNALPLHTRMRAAGMAIAYECPKLIATAIVNEGSFAELLDRRIAKLQAMEQAKLIDAKPNEKKGGNADARLPPPIPDRRYRRF